MAKKIMGYVKLQVPAGAANPSPPIGPALGQRGLNIMEFCKAFNAKTQDQEKGMPIPVTITVFSDKSFTFEMKTPPASYFLKKAAKLEGGSKAPGRDFAGSVTKAQVREIAEGQDEGPERQRCGDGHAHDRRLGALDGHRGEAMRSSAFKKAVEGIDAAKAYPVEEAVKLVKARATAKFDETIELAINLGVDPQARRSDGARRGFAAQRHGPLVARGGVRQGREGRRSQEGGCGYRGRRGTGREGQQGRDRFRPLHRHARHDGRRGPPR